MNKPILTVKSYFFDRQKVIDAVGKARVRVLSRLGAFIRTRARRSMKKAPATPKVGAKIRKNARSQYSRPGQAPYYRVGLLKDRLFFSYDPTADSVVIGPESIKSRPEVPGLMEYGGIVTRNGKRLVYKPRPFMQPAYEAEMRNLPRELKDMI